MARRAPNGFPVRRSDDAEPDWLVSATSLVTCCAVIGCAVCTVVFTNKQVVCSPISRVRSGVRLSASPFFFSKTNSLNRNPSASYRSVTYVVARCRVAWAVRIPGSGNTGEWPGAGRRHRACHTSGCLKFGRINPRGLPEMSRIKKASKSFALLACLVFLLAPLVGCQLSSPVAPDAAAESSDGISGSHPGDTGPNAVVVGEGVGG